MTEELEETYSCLPDGEAHHFTLRRGQVLATWAVFVPADPSAPPLPTSLVLFAAPSQADWAQGRDRGRALAADTIAGPALAPGYIATGCCTELVRSRLDQYLTHLQKV